MVQSIQVRIDSKLKKEVEKIFEDIGIDTPTAIRIFFKKVARLGTIPFSLTTYNTDSEAQAKLEQKILGALEHDEQHGPFNSVDDLVSSLESPQA